MKKLFISIVLLFFSNALLSQTYDANLNSLNFGTNFVNKIGNGQSNGDKVLYTNVITIGGQSIDVIVTTVSVNNVSSFTNYDDNGSDTSFFSPKLSFGSGGGSFKVNFQFILGGSYNNSTNSGTNVQVKNFYLNTYDLDGNGTIGTNQFNEFQFFSSYELGGSFLASTNASNTPQAGYSVVNVIPIPSQNTTKFRSTHYKNSGTTTAPETRVRLTYANPISNVTVNMGSEGSGLAYFYIDFSVGPSFSSAVSTQDADSDGIIDTNDLCSNTPLGVTVNSDGCPIPNGPVTVVSQTTTDTTPTITGTVTLAAGENLTVVINNVSYTTSNGLVINGGNWSLPITNALPIATYDVTAFITNSSGYILNDSTSNELVITTVPAQNIWYVDNNSNTGDIYTASSVSGNDTTGTGSASAPFATLAKAVASASAGDIIYVDSGTYSQNSITINKKLTIIGAGTGNTIFDNGDGAQLWANITSSNVTIKNLTLTKFFNAVGTLGQVININGAYTGINIENIIINNCLGATATLPNVNVSGGASVTIKNSFFKCSGYNGAMGGGLLVNNSTAVIENTIFYQNESASSTENGGAIQIKGASANVTVTNCTFNGCVSLKGGAIGQNAGTLTITGSCFSNNISETDDNSSGGGAIFVNGTSNTSISNCLFDTNAATAQAKGTSSISVGNATSADGGAICFKSVTGTASVTNCRFVNNGKLLQTDGQILVNGFDDGQDIYYSGSSLNITISNNTFSSANSGEVNIYEDSNGSQTMSNNGIYTQTGSTGPTVSTLLTTRTGVTDGTQTGWTDTTVTGTTTINMLGSLLTPIRTDVYSTCSSTPFSNWTDNSITQGGTCNSAINTTGYLNFLLSTSSTTSPAMDFSSSSAGKYLTFRARTNGGTNTAANTITVSVSTDNGSNWTIIGTRTPTTSTLTQMTPFDLSTYSGTQVKVRFQSLSATGTIGVGIDDISITNASTIITPTLDFSNKGVQVLYTSALLGGTNTTYNLIKTSISEDDGITWSQVNTSTSAGTYTLDLYNYHSTTTKLKFETPYANGTTGASIDNITFNYASSSNTDPDTYCQSPSSISGCNVTLNCSSDVLAPVILNCVENKTISDCSLVLPDFRSEVSAYDDCSFTITQNPAPGTLLSSLGNGNHTITFTVSDISTFSSDTSCSMVLNISGCISCIPPSIPAGSVTVQPTCAVTTGTIVFTTQSGVEYSIDGTNYQSSATFTGVAPGSYTLSVRSTTDNTCTTTGSSVTVNAVPSAPATPVASVTVQPTCAVTTGTIVFTTQSGVEYSIDGTNYQSSAIFTGVAPGSYTLSVRSTTDNTCTTTGSSVTVNAVPSAPATPVASVTVQPTCAVTTGTIVFTTQSGVEYSIDGTNYQSSATFTGVAPGSYTLSVRSTTDNTCTTTGSSVTVNAVPSAPATPVASVTVQPTCAVTTGTIVFTTQSGVEYSIDGTNYQSSATFTGVAPGSYTLSVRSTTDNTCTTTGSSVTVNAVPSAPATPVASVTVQPTCAVTTGTIVFTTQSGVEYSIDGTNYQSSAIFTGVAPGSYTLSVRSTTDNTCTTTGSSVTVNAVPSAPATPVASVTVQPTCAVTTGTIVFTTQSGVEYSIDGTNYQSSATFTGVAPGSYTLSVRSTTDNTCTTTGSSVTVNAVPSAPATPVASVTVQPTCAVTTGTIVFTTQSGVEYSIDGTNYQSSATFTGVAPGSYTLSVRSTTDNTCTTTGSSVTVNAVPSAPATPVASVTVQPTCAVTTGTIVFTTQSGVEYSIDGTNYQSSATFTGVAPGSYTLSVRSTTDNTCTTTGSSVTVNAVPSAPATPVASVTVQPTCAVTTGTIVFTTQSGVEYSIDGTNYQSSATFTGVAPGSYTLSVRSTTDNTCTTTGSSVTVNAVPSAPATPVASVTVQPTCAVTTGTIVFTTQSGVEYSIDGTNYQSSATFTGVAPGSYTLSVRSTTDNTCTTTGSSVTVNAVPSAPATPVASVTVQPTCAVTTGTIVFTTQSGVEYSIDGTNYQSSAIFTGVAPGSYTLSVRSTTDNTCTTTGSSVTVNAVPSAPATPVASVTVQPTCAVTTGTIVFTTQSGVEYSIDGTNYQSSATFTGVAPGSYTLSVRSTTDNTCTTTGSSVTVNAVPSAPATPVASVTVQPTCAVTTGTIVFTTQSGVEYSIDGTNYQSSATFTGVAPGSYTLSVRSTTDNTCTTTGSSVTVNAVPSAPATPVASVTVQPTCAVTTGTIVFTTQSGVEYSIDGTNYQSSAIFTGLAPGSYTLSVRSTTDNTCTTTGSSVTVNAVPSAPATPVASVTVQPTCAVTTGTIVFTTQSGVEYSIDGTNYQSSAIFTGVAPGSYTLSVRSTTDNTCTTTGSSVTVNAVPSAPATPVASVTVQPTCAVTTGTIVFTTQSGVEYSIDGTNYQSSAIFTGLAPGSYTLSVRSTTDNTCTTTGSSVTVNAVPSAPATPVASVTVQPTCAVTTGTIVFTTQSGVEYSIDGTNYQSSAIFTGVAPGSYTLSVRSTTDNTCTTTGSSVTVNAVPSAPATPVASVTVQPTCAVTTGTIVFTTQSGVEYSIDGTNYQSSATFTGVAPGSYTLSVRSTTDNTCTTTGSSVTVNAVPSAPATPVASVTVQPTCAVTTGTIVFTTQSGVEYSIDGTNYQSSAIFTGVAPGSYTLSVRSTTDNTCTTTGSSVTVNAVPSAPATPVASVTVQPTCAVTTGTIVFTTQSGVEYSIDGTNYQSSATFTGVAPGSYTLSVRSTTDNTCTTTGSSVTVNAVPSAPATPVASVTVQPTCAVTTGTIVFTTQSGVEYSIDGTNYQSSAIFTGVAPGSYTLSVRSTTDNTCTTTGSSVTVNAVPSAPATPVASVTVQPTCAVTTGTIVFTTQSGVEYSIDGTNYQSSAIFTGLAPGSYTLSVRSTTDNTCTTTGSSVTVNAVPSAPATPVASVTVQPTCAVTTGTIVFTTQSGVEYSIDGTNYQSSAIFTGVAPGSYTLSVRSTTDNTCTTTGSSVTVNAVPSAPATPVASVTVQPTCAVTTGTIVFTTQSGVEYSIDGTNYQSSAIFTGVAPGSYTLSVRSTTDNTCTTTGSSVTVNAVPSAPATPVASVTVQPTCAVTTGTIVFTTQSGVEYSIDGTNYQSSATFTGVAPGSYTLSVRSTTDNTCTTTGSSVTVNAVPSAPATPVASVTVQPTCAVTTGTIVFTTQSGVEYSIDGTNYQSSATFTGVAPGSYTLSVRSTTDNTCTTTGSSVTVNNGLCAVSDTYGPINGYTGATTASVLANDTLNGLVVTPSEITLTGVTVPTGFTLNADGTISVASGIPAGTYTFTYSICEVLNPTNCDTADAVFTIAAAPIDAVSDTYGPINGYTGATTASVLANDTLNGLVVTPSEITLTGVTVPTGFTLNADGTISVASGIPAGTYTVTYSICEVLNPTNCDTADAVFTITAAPIDAVSDTYGPINGYTGATTASVLANDTLNGLVVTPSEITLTGVTVPTGFTLNADGTISVASGIPAGTYTFTYSICEVLNPTNCDTADAVFTIAAAPIDAVSDTYGPINGYTGATTASVLANDTLNGLVVTPSEITLTGVTVPTGFTLNADGTISVASGIPAGTYTVTYSICEVLNPTNCDTADAVFTITAAPIDAVSDTYGPINGYTGATTASVLANDTLNGLVVTPSEITLTGVTVPTGFTLNADGTISVASGTPAGTYTVTYSICEVLNPTNCDTADAVVTVVPPVINAVNDDYSSTLFNGVVGGIAGDITLNDTLNGSPVLDTEITITLLDNDGISGLTIDVNGSIFIPAGTPAGSYLIQYQICEILNPTNCDVATVAIVIGSCLDFPINDCDGDGVTNGQEAIDGTDPSNPCDLVALNQDTTSNLTWLQGDCDGDGVTNGQEIIDGTNPIDSCDYQINHVLLPQGGLWLDVDCDGDGVTNGQEVIDGTDPLNPCESIEENVTLPQSEEFLDGDCDGDGLTNGEEIGNNPNSPNDANGNGIPDYLEINNHSISEDELEIFNLVTPNGDGDNDVFVIRNIELYPNNSVEIYNRWGVLVYETKGYGQNQKYFRGVSEGRVTINQASELPVGTYFYIVKYVNNQGDQKERSGYLYINR